MVRFWIIDIRNLFYYLTHIMVLSHLQHGLHLQLCLTLLCNSATANCPNMVKRTNSKFGFTRKVFKVCGSHNLSYKTLKHSIQNIILKSLEVYLPYDLVCPSVGWLVFLSKFPTRATLPCSRSSDDPKKTVFISWIKDYIAFLTK